MNIDLAKNIATNGRTFCVMSFVFTLALALSGHGSIYFYAAALAIVAVGLSYIAELAAVLGFQDHRTLMTASIITVSIIPLLTFIIAGV